MAGGFVTSSLKKCGLGFVISAPAWKEEEGPALTGAMKL
jgi:hypothetical protein